MNNNTITYFENVSFIPEDSFIPYEWKENLKGDR